MVVWVFADGMDHLAGPTAGNEGLMECCAPTESLRRGKTLNILTTEAPGKMKCGTGQWSRRECPIIKMVNLLILVCRCCQH